MQTFATQSTILGPASFGNLPEMHRAYLRPTQSEKAFWQDPQMFHMYSALKSDFKNPLK